MPNLAEFEATYEPGKIEAISYSGGQEVSRDLLCTAGQPAQIKLSCSKKSLTPDGHDAAFVMIDILDSQGLLVPDAEIKLAAKVEGAASLAGFGSGNPITDENYTDNQTVSYKGHACAVLRSGYDKGRTKLTISAPGMEDKSIELE